MTPPSDLAATIAATDPLIVPRRAVGGGSASFWRRLAAAAGPGYLVAVGYMDPGNWATGLAGGSMFGYRLLSVVVIANLVAMVLQSLAARLGIASGMDLAQACRARYGPAVRIPLWLLCEVAIIACELAEVLGTAIALQLLFHIPLPIGIMLTSLDVLLVLGLQRRGLGKLEAFVVALIALIGLCFAIELFIAKPSLAGILSGLAPDPQIIANPAMLYIAIGILGATVMPHNLYLHSSLVQRKAIGPTTQAKREAVRFATFDSTIALACALLINAAILILAAATFHHGDGAAAVGIEEAYRLLSPMLGVGAASLLFGVALLAAGQNATITGTLAGQIVLEGFTDFRLPVWARRLVSRLVAVVPAAIVAALYGAEGAGKLLVASQVVLSLQLPFAVGPLILITRDRRVMGDLVNTPRQTLLYSVIAAGLITLNLVLLAMLVL